MYRIEAASRDAQLSEIGISNAPIVSARPPQLQETLHPLCVPLVLIAPSLSNSTYTISPLFKSFLLFAYDRDPSARKAVRVWQGMFVSIRSPCLFICMTPRCRYLRSSRAWHKEMEEADVRVGPVAEYARPSSLINYLISTRVARVHAYTRAGLQSLS